jgi:hypothetical protein
LRAAFLSVSFLRALIPLAAGRMQFLPCQLAIAILVEFEEGSGRGVDLFLGKCAIAVFIQRGHHRGDRRLDRACLFSVVLGLFSFGSAFRWLRAELVLADRAVAIDVECANRLGRRFDFCGREFFVLIAVQRLHERKRRVGWRALGLILSVAGEGREEGGEGCGGCFHDLWSVVGDLAVNRHPPTMKPGDC